MSPDLEKWQSAYLRVWSKNPYSSLAMLQCVLKHNKKTPGDLIKAIDELQPEESVKPARKSLSLGKKQLMEKLNIAEWNLDLTDDEIESLWRSKHGLCTSFTIKVRHAMMEQEQELEPCARRFVIAGSLRSDTTPKHRLGWSRLTDNKGEDIVIDSSARKAYVPSSLPEYASEVTFLGEHSCRISYSGSSEQDIHVAIEGESIEDAERKAMKICLKQLLCNKRFVVAYLRMTDGQLARFYGLMSFDFGRRSLKLNIDDPAKLSDSREALFSTQRVIDWDGKGNVETAREVQEVIAWFLVDHKVQFADLAPILNEFLAACTKQWGNPRVIKQD